MAAVIRNVYGSWHIDQSGVDVVSAIERCADLTRDSHGGEVYASTDAEAERVEGESATNTPVRVFYSNTGRVISRP